MGPGRALGRLPAGVWALGVVSLLMDVSSELVHGLLPAFLVVGLGADALAVGVVAGIGEAVAAGTRAVSGAVSDWLGRRKALALTGYALATVSKPLFALAPDVGAVAIARISDRLGKGIRGAPRDALIADLTPPGLRGAAYGLRQALDTTGAFLGPLAAIALMGLSGGDFRFVFWLAAIPAVASVTVLAVAVRDVRRPPRAAAFPLRPREIRELPGAFWAVAGFGVVLTLARLSEAFLLLRGGEAGLQPTLVPVILLVMNLAYAVTAYPAGWWSDRAGRGRPVALGLGILLLAELVLAATGGSAAVLAAVALWGVHMGLTEGLLASLVADTVPAERRGTAFGVFGLLTGAGALLAGAAGGLLWRSAGHGATFLAGALLCAAAFVGWRVLDRRRSES